MDAKHVGRIYFQGKDGAKTEFLLGDNAEQSSVYTTSFSSSSPLIKVGGSHDSTSVLNVYGGVSIVRNAVSASNVRGGGISLSNYSDLNLYGGKIAYNANLSIRQDGGGAGIIGNGNDISINIYGGAVTRNALTSFNSGESSADGAGISLESGNFSENTVLSLYGGEISYNHGSDGLGSTVSSAAQAADGGGVRIHTGIFNLYGGAVSHNYTGGFGGGVIMWLSKLNMTGGEISGNHAAFGGGVAMTSNTKSSSTDSEQYTSMASVSGGKVTGNVAAERNTTQNNSTKIGGYGGGICVGAQGYYFGSKVTLSGNVEISANNAVYGGGLAVYADNGSDGGYSSYSNSNYLEMNGGTITGNTADSDEKGSGAYVSCVDRSGNVGYGEIRRSLLLLFPSSAFGQCVHRQLQQRFVCHFHRLFECAYSGHGRAYGFGFGGARAPVERIVVERQIHRFLHFVRICRPKQVPFGQHELFLLRKGKYAENSQRFFQ